MLQSENVLSVSALNAYVRQVIAKDDLLRQVVVRGEIANLRNYHGHLYFTLKDQKSSIRAVMWRNDSMRLKFSPEEGSEVLVAGNVSVFERDGVYQVYVSYMEPSGLGALYAALEELKARLEKEGLFSPERKRPLPFFPRKVGLVTSIRGAAIKDIVSVGRRRYPGVWFVAADSKVQGEGAAEEIAAGISKLNQVPGVDVIIVGRGGGSQEDLFVFNDEKVARAIYASGVPVVSAVGHERDITVADLVADARAATPSAAAELVVPDTAAINRDVAKLLERAQNQVYTLVGGYRQTLGLLRARPALERPDWFLVQSRESLVRLREDLEDTIGAAVEKAQTGFATTVSRLDALSPLRILSRGYSFCRKVPTLEIVKDYTQVEKGSSVEVTLSRGSITCLVQDSEPPGVEVGQ